MGDKLPDSIANRPELIFGLQFYWEAFWCLSSERAVGMAEGPIPWSSVANYAETFGLPLDQFSDLWYIIKAMDTVFLEERRKQADKQQKTAMKKPKSTTSGPRKR